jgi:hypothetical protein
MSMSLVGCIVIASLGAFARVSPCDVTASFEPRADITAYELAYIIQHGGDSRRVCFTQKQWDELRSIRRHYRVGS